jgi:hypothetical protein
MVLKIKKRSRFFCIPMLYCTECTECRNPYRQTSILFNVGGGGREAATINKILFCSPGRGKGYIRVSVRFPQGCGGGGGGVGEPTGIPMREKPRKHIAIILGKFFKIRRSMLI